MTEQFIIYLLAFIIIVFSVMTVTSKLILRSATYLLFVLLATAGLFLLLNYKFLFAVQITIYAGGIMVLFIMAIFLTHKPGKNIPPKHGWRMKASLLLSLAGLAMCGHIIWNNVTRIYTYIADKKITMQEIGTAMLGTGKDEYLLPFETMSVLLLVCIVGALLIARRPKAVETDNNETQLN